MSKKQRVTKYAAQLLEALVDLRDVEIARKTDPYLFRSLSPQYLQQVIKNADEAILEATGG